MSLTFVHTGELRESLVKTRENYKPKLKIVKCIIWKKLKSLLN